jgi:hypothetical protein
MDRHHRTEPVPERNAITAGDTDEPAVRPHEVCEVVFRAVAPAVPAGTLRERTNVGEPPTFVVNGHVNE